MSMPSGMELLVILGIIVLLFGSKKIPELAKGIGQGIKNFKKEMSEDTVATANTDAPKKVEGSEESATHTKTTTQA
ncbi:MAG: twin-arginine translocase TatA/TatE family subunit [Campylobacterales bacterium]|nr:twin-arginine translocase TatA/TatE family subunit [Campylobacterales bacterium]